MWTRWLHPGLSWGADGLWLVGMVARADLLVYGLVSLFHDFVGGWESWAVWSGCALGLVIVFGTLLLWVYQRVAGEWHRLGACVATGGVGAFVAGTGFWLCTDGSAALRLNPPAVWVLASVIYGGPLGGAFTTPPWVPLGLLAYAILRFLGSPRRSRPTG